MDVRKLTFWIVVFIVTASGYLRGQTNVSGLISSNTTWTLANSPYRVTGNILVSDSATLTIGPGVTVKFDTTRTLQIDGELIAIGTALSRITFAATDSTPVRGSWGRIQFSTTATDAVFDTSGNYVSGSIMKYCDIIYGGGVAGDVTVYCDTAAPYFSNCRIKESKKNVIRFVNAVGRVDSSSFRDNGGTAIEYNNPDSADLVVKNDTLENNEGGVGSSGSGTFTNVTVQNSIFTNSGNIISNVASSASVVIVNNVFTSNSTAVNVTSSMNSDIANNVFTSNSTGISVTSSMISDIANNVFTSNSTAIHVISSAIAGIENNTFISNSIALDLTSLASSLIKNNAFRSNSKAIQGALGANATISYNVFTSNTNSVVGATECDVICPFGNCFTETRFTLTAGNLTISNNNFLNNKGAIVAQGTYFTIQNNTFTNNQFIRVPCSYDYDLLRLSKAQGLITDNVFSGNTSSVSGGILIRFTGQWEIANNRVQNNSGGLSFRGKANICSNQFVNNSGTVINSFDTIVGPFIHDNQFSNISGTGTIISVTSGTIKNNEVVNNSSNGSVISVSSGSAIDNNKFQSNSSTAALISISGSPSTFSNNRLLNSNSGSNSIISISNSSSNILNNSFLNNNGLSCMRISGANQLFVTQNNFINPNVQYEIENQIPFGSNLNIDSNYWGTTRTTHIDSVIKDFFDDGSLSVVYYTPVLTSPAAVDTTALCFTDTAVFISGVILTEDSVPVPGVTIALSGDYNLIMTTDTSGHYNFAVPKGGSYSIKPSKNNDVTVNNGISSLDNLLMRKHTLSIMPLGSPYKIIAAAECSAEGDSTISNLDILLTRSLIIGMATSYPTNRLWQFVSSDYVFADPTNPFPFPNSRTYTNITANQTGQDFIGMKLGDVNGSWDANIP